jgi:two-component system, NtrC family, sensor kinase
MLGLLVLVTLALLLALAVGLITVGEHHLEPLQRDAETLSEAQVQLVGLMVKMQDRSVPEAASRPTPDPGSALLPAVESLSGQIKQSLANLDLAQRAYLSLTRTAAAGILLLVLLLASLAFLARRRVLHPLRALADLLRRLARRDFSPEPLDDVDAVLHPVFESYNFLVLRLARLEKAHEARHDETARQVTEAVRVLMAQRAELDRMERLAAVGEVAARLAHEIRNPLAAMRAACSSLMEDLPDLDSRERLGLIAAEVDRLIDLVREQLRHSRHRPEAVTATDLPALIEGLVQLLAYQMPEGVRIAVDTQAPLRVELAPDGLRRSLLNLIRNAQDALGEGGGTIRVTAALRDAALEVRVEDDGKGFPPEILQRGVRTFISSREDGTGLGLSIVKRFVEEHGGHLDLENRSQGGGQVTLRIPTVRG